MRREHGNGRPGKSGHMSPTTIKNTTTVTRFRDAERHVDVTIQCASLREHARHMCDVDPSGWLSAQLADLADLLEVAERRGWFGGDAT